MTKKLIRSRHSAWPAWGRAITASTILLLTHGVQGQPTLDDCKMFMAASDTNRDQLLDRDPEYIRFVNLISRRYYGPTFASFDDLPPGLQSNYDHLAPSSNGEIDIAGSFPGSSLTDEQSLILSDICDETSEVLRTIATTAAPSESSNIMSVSAPASSPVAIVLQSTQISLDCRKSIIVSDSNHDGFIGEVEYITFVNRLANDAYDNVAFFTEFPQAIQSNFNSLATNDKMDIFGAAPSQWPQAGPQQRSFLQKLCLQTEFSIQSAAASPKTSTVTTLQPVQSNQATSPPVVNPNTLNTNASLVLDKKQEAPDLEVAPERNVSGTASISTTNRTSNTSTSATLTGAPKEEVDQNLGSGVTATIVVILCIFLAILVALYFGWLPKWLSFGSNFWRSAVFRWERFRRGSRLSRPVGRHKVEECYCDDEYSETFEETNRKDFDDLEFSLHDNGNGENATYQDDDSSSHQCPLLGPGMNDLDSMRDTAPTQHALGRVVVDQPTEIEESHTDLEKYDFDDLSESTTMSLYYTTQDPAVAVTTVTSASSESEDDLLDFFEKPQDRQGGASTSSTKTTEKDMTTSEDHTDRITQENLDGNGGEDLFILPSASFDTLKNVQDTACKKNSGVHPEKSGIADPKLLDSDQSSNKISGKDQMNENLSINKERDRSRDTTKSLRLESTADKEWAGSSGNGKMERNLSMINKRERIRSTKLSSVRSTSNRKLIGRGNRTGEQALSTINKNDADLPDIGRKRTGFDPDLGSFVIFQPDDDIDDISDLPSPSPNNLKVLQKTTSRDDDNINLVASGVARHKHSSSQQICSKTSDIAQVEHILPLQVQDDDDENDGGMDTSTNTNKSDFPSVARDGITTESDGDCHSDTSRQLQGHQEVLHVDENGQVQRQQRHEPEERGEHYEQDYEHRQDIDPELRQQIEHLVDEVMPNGKNKIYSMLMQYQGREDELVHTLQRLKVRMGSNQTRKVQTLNRSGSTGKLGISTDFPRITLSSVAAECAVLAAGAATTDGEKQEDCASSIMSVSETSPGLLESSDEDDDQELFSEEESDESSIEMTVESSFDIDSDYDQDASTKRPLSTVPPHIKGLKKCLMPAPNRMPAELVFPGI